MSGIQEILVVLLVIVILFYLPRRTGQKGASPVAGSRRSLSGRMRLAVLASLIWLAIASYLTQPWQNDILPFAFYGLGPVTLAWGIFWVVVGYRNRS